MAPSAQCSAPAPKIGILAGLICGIAGAIYLAASIYSAVSGQPHLLTTFGPAVLAACLLILVIVLIIVSALVCAGLASLGAVFALSRPRSA